LTIAIFWSIISLNPNPERTKMSDIQDQFQELLITDFDQLPSSIDLANRQSIVKASVDFQFRLWFKPAIVEVFNSMVQSGSRSCYFDLPEEFKPFIIVEHVPYMVRDLHEQLNSLGYQITTHNNRLLFEVKSK
jgi:hypothetical protein